MSVITGLKNEDWSTVIEVFPIQYFTGEIRKGIWSADMPETTRSQEIPKKFVPSGRLYLYNCKNTIEKNNAFGHKVIPVFTEQWKNINIDEQDDLDKLKIVYQMYKKDFNYLTE